MWISVGGVDWYLEDSGSQGLQGRDKGLFRASIGQIWGATRVGDQSGVCRPPIEVSGGIESCREL